MFGVLERGQHFWLHLASDFHARLIDFGSDTRKTVLYSSAASLGFKIAL